MTPGQSHLFHALIPELGERISCISSTDFAETNDLLRNFGIRPDVVGRHLEQKTLWKYVKVFERLLLLTLKLKAFDVSLSFQNFYAPLAAWFRGKTNISLFDNLEYLSPQCAFHQRSNQMHCNSFQELLHKS